MVSLRMPMFRSTQFGISTLLLATLLVAIVVGFSHIWQVVVLVIEISMVLVGCEILLRQLPKNVKSAIERNCTRFDGSWSSQRESAEWHALRKLRSNIRFLLVMVLLPWNLLYWHDQFQFWQLITMLLLGLTLSCVLIRQGYLQFLHNYIFGLKRRAQNYTIRDLKLVENPVPAHVSNRRPRQSPVENTKQFLA